MPGCPASYWLVGVVVCHLVVLVDQLRPDVELDLGVLGIELSLVPAGHPSLPSQDAQCTG